MTYLHETSLTSRFYMWSLINHFVESTVCATKPEVNIFTAPKYGWSLTFDDWYQTSTRYSSGWRLISNINQIEFWLTFDIKHQPDIVLVDVWRKLFFQQGGYGRAPERRVRPRPPVGRENSGARDPGPRWAGGLGLRAPAPGYLFWIYIPWNAKKTYT